MLAAQLAADSLAFAGMLIILGQSIVVTHIGSGVTNFAAAAIGMVSTYVFSDLYPADIPWPLALLLSLLLAAAIGALIYLFVLRKLRESSVAAKIVATLGVMILLTALSAQYWARSGQVRAVNSFLPSGSFNLTKNVHVPETGLTILVIAIALTVGLRVLQTRTRFGLGTLAVCENETVASGMGLSPTVISTANWALGCAIAALGIILISPISGLSPTTTPLLVVPSLGAAMIGRFDSAWLTLVGGVAIALGESEVGLFTSAPGWAEALPLIAIVLVLVIRRPPRFDRSDAAGRLAMVGSGHIGAWAWVAGAGSLVAILFVSIDWLNPIVASMIAAVVMLSVVVITGYAGQLSLAQFGLAGLGAFLTAMFGAGVGLPLWLAMVLGVVLTVPCGLVIGIPALRTKGPTLAIATLSLVIVIDDLLLDNQDTASWFGSGALPTLKLFGVSFSTVTHPRSFAIFCWVVLVLVALATINLRRNALGRRLLTVRTNPQAAQAIGVSPVAMKIYAFSVSAVMAAICGALVESEFPFTSFTSFGTMSSITVVLQTTIGGLGFVGGGLSGGAGAPSGLASRVLSTFVSPSNWLDVITGALVILILLQSPDGIAAQVSGQLRWVRARVARAWGERSRPAFWPRRRAPGNTFSAALAASRIREGQRRSAALEVSGLSVTFGGVRALRDTTLSVSPGEVVGLIGPNGAGKTTFIDAVCGLVNTSGGTIRLDGEDLARLGVTSRARLGLSRSFQSLELFEDMTVGDNLLAACEQVSWWDGIRGLLWPRKAHITEAAARAASDFGLDQLVGEFPRNLDHGRRRLVAIARAFATNPSVLLLDEPAAGLDAQERRELGLILRRVAADWQVGILLVEHDVDLVFRTCDRVVALVSGVTVATGQPDEVRTNPEVVRAYLGSADDGAAPARELVGAETLDVVEDPATSARIEVLERELAGSSPLVAPGPDWRLTTSDLAVGYSGVPVVSDVSISIGAGEIVALLGRNGAGKTTLIHTLAGIVPAVGGRFSHDGRDVMAMPFHRRARGGLGLVSEERAVIRRLTVAENLRLAPGPADEAYRRFPELEALRDHRAGLLSGGEQQMLALANALAARPQVLLIDELSLGLAPLIVDRLLREVRQAAMVDGTAVLLVEQQSETALRVADRAYVIAGGQVCISGTASEMRNRRQEIEELYLAV